MDSVDAGVATGGVGRSATVRGPGGYPMRLDTGARRGTVTRTGAGPASGVRDLVTVLVLAVDLIALLLAAAGTHGAGQLLAGLVACLTVPGWAVVAHLDLRWPAAEVTLTLAGSLAVLLLVAQVMLMTHAWHPAAATWVVGTASGALLTARLVRSRRAMHPVQR